LGFNYQTNEELLMPLYLTDIILKFHDVSFDEIEKFLPRISHQLQRLRLTIHMNNAFLCADRWERLILNHVPNLYQFDLTYFIFEDEPSNELFDRFKSSFWKNRNWFFKHQHWSCKRKPVLVFACSQTNTNDNNY
jgi:hypothetical protein